MNDEYKKYISTARVFPKCFLADVLRWDFFAKFSAGHTVLVNPSLETFEPRPQHDEEPGKREGPNFESIWADLYGKFPNVEATIILPLVLKRKRKTTTPGDEGAPPSPPCFCLPRYVSVKPLVDLVVKLGEDPESQLAKSFKTLSNKVTVLFASTAAGSPSIPTGAALNFSNYSFALYFSNIGRDEINKAEKEIRSKDLTPNVWIDEPDKWSRAPYCKNLADKDNSALILGTTISRPFGHVNDKGFEYHTLLRFDENSRLLEAEDKDLDIRCVMLEHLRLVFSAVTQVPNLADLPAEHKLWNIDIRKQMPLDRFLAWVALEYEQFAFEKWGARNLKNTLYSVFKAQKLFVPMHTNETEPGTETRRPHQPATTRGK